MKKLLLCTTFLLATACKSPNVISIVGLDEKGKEVDLIIDKQLYQQALSKHVKEINLSVYENLDDGTNPKWELTKIDIGILVTPSVSIGPVWKWSFSAGQRIIFTKN